MTAQIFWHRPTVAVSLASRQSGARAARVMQRSLDGEAGRQLLTVAREGEGRDRTSRRLRTWRRRRTFRADLALIDVVGARHFGGAERRGLDGAVSGTDEKSRICSAVGGYMW